MRNLAWTISLVAGLGAACLGCAKIARVGAGIGEATGTITPEQGESIRRSADAVQKTFADITPEQEYYIGRAVAATILDGYKPYTDETANHYVSVLGNILSLASDKPETFGGYHFQILETSEINAFAAPGGLIMVSRGMLRCCRTEDELAAVLAHEIGHIQGAHGLRAIRKDRLTGALTVLAAEGAKNFGGQDVAKLTDALEGTVSDVTGTLMNSGYARHLEREADMTAVTILKRVGYDPTALVSVLKQMKVNTRPGMGGFAKTHPDPQDRINDLLPVLKAGGAAAGPPSRQQRFDKAMAKVM